MDVQLSTARCQRRLERIDRKHTATTIEVGYIALLEMIPGCIAHSFGQHGVEYQAARGGKHKSTLRRVQCTQAACYAREVGSFATESLRAKVVGHASLAYLGQPRSERAR